MPLGSELTTFRKLVVGNRQFRIVFRVDADGTVVVVWVIANQVDTESYDLAVARLALYGDKEVVGRLKEVVEHAFGQ
jgi:mRNA interferase RelE/StbE